MSTENCKARNGKLFLLPIITALPVVAAMTFLMIRFGPTVHKMISIMIKLAVTE